MEKENNNKNNPNEKNDKDLVVAERVHFDNPNELLNSSFRKSNVTVQTRSKLTKLELDVYDVLTQVARKNLEKNIDLDRFKFDLSTLNKILGFDGTIINMSKVKEALRTLLTSDVQLNVRGEDGRIKQEHYFTFITGYMIDKENSNEITFGLPFKIMDIYKTHVKISNGDIISEGEGKSKKWFEINEENGKIIKTEVENSGFIGDISLKSNLSIKKPMARKIVQYVNGYNLKKHQPPMLWLDELKAITGTEGKYDKSFFEYERKLLKPSLKEIKDSSLPFLVKYKKKTRNDMKHGEVKGVYFTVHKKKVSVGEHIKEDAILARVKEMLPVKWRGYKTLPDVINLAVKKYDADFVFQQAKYSAENCTSAFMSYFKKTLTDESYDEYLYWKEEEEKKNKPKVKDTTEDTTKENKGVDIKIDDLSDKQVTERIKELSKLLIVKSGTPEMGEILMELTELNNKAINSVISEEDKKDVNQIDIDYGNGSKCTLKRNEKEIERHKEFHDVNKIIKPRDIEDKKEYTEEDINAATGRYIMANNLTTDGINEFHSKTEKEKIEILKKYL